MVEFDLAGQGFGLEAVGIFGDDGVGVEDGTDALGTNCSLGDGVGRGGEILDGLEELREVGEVDGEFADGHCAGQDKRRSAPEHDCGAERDCNVHDRRKERLDAAGLEGCAYCCFADIVEELFFYLFLTEGFDYLDGFEILLGYGKNGALLFADFVGRVFGGGSFNLETEGKRWRTAQAMRVKSQLSQNMRPSMQRIVEIDEDAERGRGREALDGLDVGGEGAEDRAGLMGAVVAEGEALQVLIQTHAQIVGDPLADALGVVVVDVGRGRADDGDHYECNGSKGGDVELVASLQHGPEQMMKPGSELVIADDVVEDDLQRPWGREAHRRFDNHAEKNDRQGAPMGRIKPPTKRSMKLVPGNGRLYDA